MSDNDSNHSRRSSSQISQISNEGKKPKLPRDGQKRHGSKASTTPSFEEDPSLTSFPSFSPEHDLPQKSKEEQTPKVGRTMSQKVRERKSTLAGLTNASIGFDGQNPLFDDSPRSSLDMPGSLHLSNDNHIQRLIARVGAVKLVRQYASDLAQRDAEISALRIRADNRERELKRLLRESNVTTADVETRLLRLEQSTNSVSDNKSRTSEHMKNTRSSLDGMMNEAMSDNMVPNSSDVHRNTGIGKGFNASAPAQQSMGQVNDDSVFGEAARPSTVMSRSPSRTSSVVSHDGRDSEATLRPRVSSTNDNRLSGLQSLFQTPSQPKSYFIGGNRTVKKPKHGDEVSIKSNQSSNSFSSWTQIFGGKTQTNRPRSASLEPAEPAIHSNGEASASLGKLITNRMTSNQPATKSASALVPNDSANSRNTGGRRTPVTNRFPANSNHIRKESNASSLPPTVELDSMLEPSALPPTMVSQNPDVNGLLVDRFGFIYDQRRQKRSNSNFDRQKHNRRNGTQTLAKLSSSQDTERLLHNERQISPEPMNEEAPKRSWQDYLKVPPNLSLSRPSELLSHTPSASAVVTVNTEDVKGTITPPRNRDYSNSISAADHKAHQVESSAAEPQSSAINVLSVPHPSQHDDAVGAESSSTKLLLEQLNDLHDSLQAERNLKWNDFLRRVRAERSTGNDRSTNNAPEAELLDGELIGIATLGRSSKSKGKYAHFKTLVLGGIPVSLRSKIWAECSGASSIRIPGYYDDLVSQSQDVDPTTSSQIIADVRRTLTDNIFFRQGPGVQRLEELLRAYALHNQEIGYCQGLNLLGASLLLICATVEQCFWLLVQIIDHILPSGYFTHDLIVSRADQQVFRSYVSEILPKLDAKLKELDIELEACTFHWFLSIYAGVLTGGEALYRVWDVIIALNSSDLMSDPFSEDGKLTVEMPTVATSTPSTPVTTVNSQTNNKNGHDGTGSPFLFCLGLALLKLNESAILALESPAQVYTYINHNMTNHAISIDALIQASEALRTRIKRSEVLDRRAAVVKTLST